MSFIKKTGLPLQEQNTLKCSQKPVNMPSERLFI